MKLHLDWPVSVAAAALVLAGCSSSDSGSTEESSASSSASATSTSAAAAPSPEAEKAATEYKAYAVGQIDELVGAVKVLTDAVRANNLQAAQDAYAPSRMPWERIEPLAGLVEDIDGKVDSRVDDFAGEDDPAFTGWHRLEFLLFNKNTTEGGAPFADQLDKDIADLKTQFASVEVKPLDVANGAAELIEEVSEGKITGEEDRYSRTDLWDFDANVDGSKKLFELLTPALQAKDAALTAEIAAGFAAVDTSLSTYANPDGSFDSYTALKAADKTRMQAELAGLSEKLARIPGVLGLKG